MSERRERLRLGFFVFVSLLLLAGLVLFFGGAPNWFLKRDSYSVRFTDAPGIDVGTPVRKSGVKVGEVGRVDLDSSTGDVLVSLRIDPKFQPRTTDVPTITRGLLTGDTSVDFIPREIPKKGEPIPPGSEIKGLVPPNARQLLEQASDVIPEAEKSLNQIRLSMQKLEELAPQLNTTLKEIGELARVTKEFVPELRRATDDIRDVFANAKDLGPELRKTNEEIRFFLKTASVWTENIGLMLKTNEPRIQAALDSVTRTLDQATKLMNDENQKNFTELLRNLSSASRTLEPLGKETTALVQEGRSTMQQFNKTLLRGDEVMADIQKATRPFADKAPKILQNLESGSDQFARLLLDVREMMRDISRADGAFQRFFSDPTLYHNLSATAEAIAKTMPRIDRVLRDLEVFADKIARHPESLGVGGAVRPSAGLKEAPGSTTPRPR